MCCQPFRYFLANSQLPASAATVEAAPATVETTSTVNAASAMETSSAAETTTRVPMAADIPMAACVAARIAPIITADIPVSITPAAATVVAAIPEHSRVSPVVPRAYPDEHSVHKIIGT